MPGGAELDLLIVKNGRRYGFECKYTEKFSVTSSMKIALKDLKLEPLDVIFPGRQSFPLAGQITAQGPRYLAVILIFIYIFFANKPKNG